MTMPEERTRAVLQTKDFLVRLSKDKSLSDDVRGEAKGLLRHFPSEDDMANVVKYETNSKLYASWCYQTFGKPEEYSWKVIRPEDGIPHGLRIPEPNGE